MTENEIFDDIKNALKEEKDFDAFLKKSVQYDDRAWTYGQFLYKHFYDQIFDFNQKIQDNEKCLEKLPPEEQKLAKKIISMFASGLDKPTVDLNDEKIRQKAKDLDLFDGDENKEKFYTDLFTRRRSVKGNPCYWPPVSQYHFLVIEHKLKSELGMTESQVRSLMVHCEEEREKVEKYHKDNMPDQFWHNSPVCPDDMKKSMVLRGAIEARWRPVDNWLNVQKYCFMTISKSFHSGLPIQGKNEFLSWPRFDPKVCVFYMSKKEFEEKTEKGSYNYEIDMFKKDFFRPVIPLWGGEPKEWVSVKNVCYKSPIEKETLQNLIEKQKMKFYLIEDKEVFNSVQGKGNWSPETAEIEMEKLCAQGKAIRYVHKDTSSECVKSIKAQSQR